MDLLNIKLPLSPREPQTDDHAIVVIVINMMLRYLPLTFTTLLANSADDNLVIFHYFPNKQDLTFHANCLHWAHK